MLINYRKSLQLQFMALLDSSNCRNISNLIGVNKFNAIIDGVVVKFNLWIFKEVLLRTRKDHNLVILVESR